MHASSKKVLQDGLAESWQRKLALAILATNDAENISAFIDRVSAKYLGWLEVDCFLFELSVGAVIGLSNGRQKCIMKVFSPDSDVAPLLAQSRFQQYLSDNGFPCPSVLIAPKVEQGVVLAVEDYLDSGRRANGHLRKDRKLMSETLAKLVTLGEQYDAQIEIPPRVLQPVAGSPWPKPHNTLFDFTATSVGAEWIDEIGWRYKAIVDSHDEPIAIGHIDWGAKHIRIEDDCVTAVYDWDSVVRMPEARIVGEAATNFATTWYVECSNRPHLTEMTDFLFHYQAAREINFSAEQRELLVASMFYSAGYAARCEHAIKRQAGVTENCDFLKMLIDSGIGTDANAILR